MNHGAAAVRKNGQSIWSTKQKVAVRCAASEYESSTVVKTLFKFTVLLAWPFANLIFMQFISTLTASSLEAKCLLALLMEYKRSTSFWPKGTL